MVFISGLAAVPVALFLYFSFATAINPVSLRLTNLSPWDYRIGGEASGGDSYEDFYWPGVVPRVNIAVGFGCPATYREFTYTVSRHA